MTPEHDTPHEFTAALAKRYRVTQPDLLALDRSNDPFHSGTPSSIVKATWFAAAFEQIGRPHVHLRDVHYQLIVRAVTRRDGRVYEGTAKDWRELQEGSRKARDLGLVSPWALVDRRSQAFYRYGEARDRPAQPPRIEPGEAFIGRPTLDVPEWEIAPPTLQDVPTSLRLQPVAVEIWVEKDSDALNRELWPVADSYGCHILVGAGYQSMTAAAAAVRRAIDDGRPRVVLWLGDADSDGESMAIATARHVEFLCRWWLPRYEPETFVPRIVVDQVALTLDQLADVEAEIGREIPRSPDRNRDEGRVEIQALAAFAPGWVGVELRRRLDELTDPRLSYVLNEWGDEAKAEIEAAWEEEIGPSELALNALRERRDAILERFDLAGLNAALDEIESERRDLEGEIGAITDHFCVPLPELPEGDVDLDADGRDWLLDPERGYLEQLDAYRRHEPIHRRRDELDLTEPEDRDAPTCEFCGDPLPAGRTRFCDEAERKRYERGRQ